MHYDHRQCLHITWQEIRLYGRNMSLEMHRRPTHVLIGDSAEPRNSLKYILPLDGTISR